MGDKKPGRGPKNGPKKGKCNTEFSKEICPTKNSKTNKES